MAHISDLGGLLGNYCLSPQFIWQVFKMSVCSFLSSRPKQLLPMGISPISVEA